MTGLRNLAAWGRRHRLVIDVPVAAVTFLVSVVGPPGQRSEQMFAATGSGTTLVVGVACLLLVARGRFPVWVWGLTLALAVGSMAVVEGASPVLLPALVGIYTLVVSQEAKFAVPAALGSAIVLALTLGVRGTLPFLHPVTYAMLSWCALACALGVALRNRRAVLAAAVERARRAEQGREDEAQRRVGEERLRIARELHDVLAHHISVINVQSGAARHLLATNPAAATESIEHVREASALVLAEIPTILGLLRSDEATIETSPAPGLAQMQQLVESMRRTGLDLSWQVSGAPVALPPTTDLTAFRLLQEALTNAQKHGSGHADMSVAYEEDRVVLTVQNPVNPSGVDLDGAGHGLIGMNERVASVGGRLRAGPGDGSTFVVRAELFTGALA